MASALRLIQLCLLAVTIFSLWGTWGLMRTDGLVSSMQALRDRGPHLLPGTSEPLRQFYTGIRPIDYQLTVLCVFFWSIIDGSHPEYKLHIFDFAFQFAVQYAFCVLEGTRPGNKGRWISYIALYGAAMQNIGVANVLPIFALAYLAYSPTVRNPTLSQILPQKLEMDSLPISMLLGYFLPIVLMGLPSFPADSQQIWLGFWQAFPLWVAIFQQIFPALMSSFALTKSTKDDMSSRICSLRATYSFLKYLSIFGHLTTWALSLKTLETPHLFATGVPDALHPRKVWLPEGITSALKVSSIGAGAHLFLQYDRIGSSMAGLIFAYALYSQSRHHDGTGFISGILHLIKTAGLASLIGPAGTMIALVEARDEVLIAIHESDSKKDQ